MASKREIAERIKEAGGRARAEAEARRQSRPEQGKPPGQGKPDEIGGRNGPDPTRFGDWEKNGLISDF